MTLRPPARTPRTVMLDRLIEAARRDDRIVGLLDYGSGGFGRADEWSDVDVAVFIRSLEFDDFFAEWKDWAGQFGRLLLGYVGKYRHPWAIYDAAPVPLRVDFDFWLETQLPIVRTWANAPPTVEAMLLYDGTGGRLEAVVRDLVGQSLAPEDLGEAFAASCGDFWYFLLYCLSKFRRGERMVARQVYDSETIQHLTYLLRLEAGAVERWRESAAAFEVEKRLAPERLARLEACLAPPDLAALDTALHAAGLLGREVCASIAAAYGWEWPDLLAERALAAITA